MHPQGVPRGLESARWTRCSTADECPAGCRLATGRLALGETLRKALGSKAGIGRYGFLLAMDESRAQVAIDLSGRAYAVFEGHFGREHVGGLPTELVPHFFRSLADSLGAAIHVTVTGENSHHMVEACFKGVGRALRQAFRREGEDLPSTKGVL